MKLRLCEPTDLRILLELGRQLVEEPGTTHLALDERKAITQTALSVQNRLAIGVENKKGELCGAILLLPQQPWYSSEFALFEVGLFVRKDARKSTAAYLLLNAAKAVADDMGLPLFLTPFNGVEIDRKDKLFERAGFARVGSIYRWN